jgi:hypothetical protein
MFVAFLFPNYTPYSRSSTLIVWCYLRSAVCAEAMSEIFIISWPKSGRYVDLLAYRLSGLRCLWVGVWSWGEGGLTSTAIIRRGICRIWLGVPRDIVGDVHKNCEILKYRVRFWMFLEGQEKHLNLTVWPYARSRKKKKKTTHTHTHIHLKALFWTVM